MRTSLAALAALACACGRGGPRPATAPSNTVAEPAGPITEPDGIVVHTRGATPHVVRRYHVAAALRTVELSSRQEVAVNGAAPQVMDVTMRWTFELAPSGADTAVHMVVKVAPGPLLGLSGDWTLSERGQVSAMTGALDARMVLQQSQAEHLLPVFPSAAIGVGARWTVPLAMSSGVGQEAVTGTTTWELVEASGSTVRARATLTVPRTQMVYDGATTMGFALAGTLETSVDLATLASQADLRLTIDGDAEPDLALQSKTTIAQTIR